MRRVSFAGWLLLIALATRLSAVLWLRDTVPYTDFVLYHVAGREIAHDLGFFLRPSTLDAYPQLHWWPPLYPLFLGLVYGVSGVDHRHAVFVQVVLGGLTCWLVYRIGQSVAREPVARVAALVVALHPSFIFVTNQLASENLFVFLSTAALFLVLRARNARRFVAAGIVFALAALTRAAGLVVPFVVALWLRRRAASRRVWLVQSAWLLAGVIVTLAPWSVRNAVLVGSPSPVSFGGGLNFYFGHNPVAMGHRDLAETPLAGLRSPVAIDRRGYALGVQHIAREPLALVQRSAIKIRDLFAYPDYALHINSGILVPDFRAHPELKALADERLERQRKRDRLLHGVLMYWARAHSLLLLLGAAGAFLSWPRLPAGLRLMALWVVAWIAVHVVFWAQPRFRLPLEIPLALLGSFAAVTLAQRIGLVPPNEH